MIAQELDMISATGLISDLPQFLRESTRQIVYRLKQAGMWHDDYDIRLYIPKKYSVEFAYIWTEYFLGVPSNIETRRLISDGIIDVDGIKIKVREGLNDRFYLVTVRVGTNNLQEYDFKSKRWLFRAPWAIAGFEATDGTI